MNRLSCVASAVTVDGLVTGGTRAPVYVAPHNTIPPCVTHVLKWKRSVIKLAGGFKREIVHEVRFEMDFFFVLEMTLATKHILGIER